MFTDQQPMFWCIVHAKVIFQGEHLLLFTWLIGEFKVLSFIDRFNLTGLCKNVPFDVW